VWTTHLPAPIATTANITLGGWGPPGPSGLGPGPPVYPAPPGGMRPSMAGLSAEITETQVTTDDTWGEPEPEPHRGRRRR
jgi:hypothetical protein